MKRVLSTIALSALTASYGLADNITVTAPIEADTVWTSDNVYLLNDYIFVRNDATLTIKPGTVIKGLDTAPSALVVTRGSRIYALGTPSMPIVMTTQAEDKAGWVGDENDIGQWGGLILLGNAPINSNKAGTGDAPLEEKIEGLPESFGADVFYGGDDANDNSGIVRYVSIRHGGIALEEGNEINGLTLGGVGDGTLIEFVEIFANRDDGIEFFGGTVNTRFMAVAFSSDDSFDYDQGWVGKGQNWFTIGTNITTDSENGDNGGEHDGEENSQGLHLGGGQIWNATYIGTGVSAPRGGGAIRIRDNGFAKYYNSIFTDYKDWGLRIEDSSASLVGTGDIEITNNIWWGFGAGNTATGVAHGTNEAPIFEAANKNLIEDPMLVSISRTLGGDGALDPRPKAGSPALTAANLKAFPAGDDFLFRQKQLGAFTAGHNWMNGWTYLSQAGYIPESLGSLDNTIFNTSVRTKLDAAANEVVAVGMIIKGSVPRMVLIRAEGKGLADDNVANPASATQLQIFNTATGEAIQGGRIWTNWETSEDAPAIAAMMEHVGFTIFDNDDTSGVALVSLAPGSYSIAVSNPDETGGEAVISTIVVDI